MQINSKAPGDNGYVAFFAGKQADVYAATSLEALNRARAYFKPSKSKLHMVHVALAEVAGVPIVVKADF